MKSNILTLSLFFLILIIITPLSYSLDKSRNEIGADIVNNLGVTGKNNTICLIDDGVDYTHPNLGNCTLNQISIGQCPTFISATDLVENDSDPYPEGEQEHGTQIAGIILSNHEKYKGISPGAKIAFVRIWDYDFINQESTTNTALVLDAIQWCIDNRNNYSISAISLSMGLGFSQSSNITSQFQSKIDNATRVGILFVKSSGNREDGDTYNMTFPADLGNVTSVGSVRNKDKISYFTRRTSNLDLLAPGDKIRSTIVGTGFTSFLGNLICWHNSDTIAGSLITRKVLPFCNYGTSFSAPHVSAAVTLLKEYDSGLKPHDIENLLKETGNDVYDSVTNSTFKMINLPAALHIYDWPTQRHDNRRTGLTLLKGDMNSSNIDNYNLYLTNGTSQEYVIRTSIADVDGNGYMEAVTVAHEKISDNETDGKVYAFERNRRFNEICPSFFPFCWEDERKWFIDLHRVIMHPPTIGNIDETIQKEVIVPTRNGTLRVLNVSTDGKTVYDKWQYLTKPKFSTFSGNNHTAELSGSAIADIDLDGNPDIIITDSAPRAVYDWPGQIYVLNQTGGLKFNATFGNAGAFGAPSIANIDEDDYPEIIIPSFYGVFVYDYNVTHNNLTLKWNNSDGLIDGEIVVYDIDRDNEYELIYSTSPVSCAAQKQCYNRTYIRDAKTGANEGPSPINYTFATMVAPTIANLDNDSNFEIVVIGTNEKVSYGLGKLRAYDASSGNLEWEYNDSNSLITPFASPVIADITGDGNLDIIFAENNGTQVYILHKNGTLNFRYFFDAFVDNALAIGDLDKDGKAEIALKRAGSPVAFTTLTAFNDPPELNLINNLTARAGDLINLNVTGQVTAIDPEGNNLTLSYSSPFNSSGLWQSTINDTGNYSILVEVSDGGITDSQFVFLQVFNTTSTYVSNLTDGSNQKILNYTQASNQSVQLRLPKNVSILYASIKIEGKGQ